jgi:ABC-type Mn2+/Zn2+ transport system permease subunit
MLETVLIFVCGAVGALIYGFMDYLRDRNSDDHDAFVKLLFAVGLGSVIAGVFTPSLAEVNTIIFGIHVNFAWLTRPRPYPLALTIGVLANKLVPILIEKVVNRVKTG